MNKYVFFDAEFSDKGEKLYKPICFSFKYGEIEKAVWNLENENLIQTQKLFEHFRKENAVLVSFSVLAEARYLLSLGINPLLFNWIDLKVEWEQVLNSNYTMEYGRHLDDNGKVMTTKPPKSKYLRSGEENEEEYSSKKAKRNLLACTYKLLNILEITSEYKDKMRDMCIAYDLPVLRENKEDLLSYCKSDIKNLPLLLKRMREEILKKCDLSIPTLERVQIQRGNYVALASIRAARGYPVNLTKLTNVSNSIETIVKDLQEDINSQFVELKPFSWEKKTNRYKTNQKKIKEFLRDKYPSWPATKKGAISLASDSFKSFRDYKYNYPKGDLIAQYSRFLSFNTTLNGVRRKANPTKKDSTIFDSIGTDERSRPYAPPFSSQTSRTYPKATSFIPAKAAWMRSLIEPKGEQVCYSLDYSSQEFLLGAIESLDENMFKAYKSGDPYMWLAIKAGSAPEGATKKTHPEIREVFKTLALAIGFGMGAASLAKDLTNKTGKHWKEGEAVALISLYFTIFSDYSDFRQDTIKRYRKEGYIMLRDGWVLFGDNPNNNSLLNFPFQGGAASIMRLAETNAHHSKVKLIYTLHDALTGECDVNDMNEVVGKLYYSMSNAFSGYFSREFLDKMDTNDHFIYSPRQEAMAKSIRLDTNIWGPSIIGSGFLENGIKYKGQTIYIDPRSVKDYEFFSKYF